MHRTLQWLLKRSILFVEVSYIELSMAHLPLRYVLQPLVFLGVSLLWLAFVRQLLPFTARADNASEVIVAVCNAGTFGCAAALALKKDATADLTCARSPLCCQKVSVLRSHLAAACPAPDHRMRNAPTPAVSIADGSLSELVMFWCASAGACRYQMPGIACSLTPV